MRKVIFDCDTGTDDAVALMLLVKSKCFDILGVTCCWGNQPVDVTSQNTLRVLDYLGSDIKVYKGCSEPLNKKLQEERIASNTEGPIYYIDEEGNQHHLHPEKLWIPDSKRSVENKHAVDFIIDVCMNSTEKITIIPVGPATNIGTAIQREPRIVDHIEQIVFMGGSVGIGNVSPTAEANFWNDPDSIKVIMDSKVPCAIAALNATLSCSLDIDADVPRLKNSSSKHAKFAGEIVDWRYDVEKHLGWSSEPKEAVHDPLAVQYLIDSSVITKLERHQVSIDTSTGMHAGTLLLDTGVGNPNVDIMMQGDKEKFLQMWIDILNKNS